MTYRPIVADLEASLRAVALKSCILVSMMEYKEALATWTYRVPKPPNLAFLFLDSFQKFPFLYDMLAPYLLLPNPFTFLGNLLGPCSPIRRAPLPIPTNMLYFEPFPERFQDSRRIPDGFMEYPEKLQNRKVLFRIFERLVEHEPSSRICGQYIRGLQRCYQEKLMGNENRDRRWPENATWWV